MLCSFSNFELQGSCATAHQVCAVNRDIMHHTTAFDSDSKAESRDSRHTERLHRRWQSRHEPAHAIVRRARQARHALSVHSLPRFVVVVFIPFSVFRFPFCRLCVMFQNLLSSQHTECKDQRPEIDQCQLTHDQFCFIFHHHVFDFFLCRFVSREYKANGGREFFLRFYFISCLFACGVVSTTYRLMNDSVAATRTPRRRCEMRRDAIDKADD
jgi:hypothetical protein